MTHGAHEPTVGARSQLRCDAGTHEPGVDARSKHRRDAGAHEPDVGARSKLRRNAWALELDGGARRSCGATQGPTSWTSAPGHSFAATHGAHERDPLVARKARRVAEMAPPVDSGGPESEAAPRSAFYGAGVSYIHAPEGESPRRISRRLGRARAPFNSAGGSWRKFARLRSLEDRATALGVYLKEAAPGDESARRNAKKIS